MGSPEPAGTFGKSTDEFSVKSNHGGTFFGGPIIRAVVFGGEYWGTLFRETTNNSMLRWDHLEFT